VYPLPETNKMAIFLEQKLKRPKPLYFPFLKKIVKKFKKSQHQTNVSPFEIFEANTTTMKKKPKKIFFIDK